MSLEILARHDRVVLKELETSEKMVGRIIESDNGKEKANCYKIVAMGPGATSPVTGQFIPTQYKVGDEVYVHKALIYEIGIDGELYFITRDNEILCYMEEINNLELENETLPF